MSQVFQKKFKKYTKNNLNFFKEKKIHGKQFCVTSIQYKKYIKNNTFTKNTEKNWEKKYEKNIIFFQYFYEKYFENTVKPVLRPPLYSKPAYSELN